MNNPNTLQIQKDNLKITPVLSEDIFGNNFIVSRNGYDFGEK